MANSLNVPDINECDVTLGLSECNITSTSCNNTNGGYHCVCKDGYRSTTEKFTQCPGILFSRLFLNELQISMSVMRRTSVGSTIVPT